MRNAERQQRKQQGMFAGDRLSTSDVIIVCAEFAWRRGSPPVLSPAQSRGLSGLDIGGDLWPQHHGMVEFPS